MSDQNIPAWAHGLTAEPESKSSRAAKAPGKPSTDAARIAEARLQSIARSKENNVPGALYGFGYNEGHYQDFAGPETSSWDASHLVFEARLIEVKLNGRDIAPNATDVYNSGTGMFGSPLNFSFQELRAAYIKRIAELGLSEVLIEEYLSVPHPEGDFGRAIWREDLATRISRFQATV